MRLKKLELTGFKSFAEKTEIVFQDGTTAIVGPNGSGKSNISDAVRWVLGEQSAKSLRGAKMEDVIFNGTEKRKPLTFCEVSLLMDNEDGALGIDAAEVLVTRRVWRSGEGEYFINRAACRLRDIQELFRDTGVGKDGYSVVGQGRVDEILSQRSEDRRHVFEEAVGIATYRARKEEAERRMDNTRQNLERVEDILSELEGQLAPLQEQAEAAKRYLSLRDTLRELDLNQFLIRHQKQTERVEQFGQALSQSQQALSQAQPRVQALQEEREQAEARADALYAQGEQANAAVLQAAREADARRAANELLRERIARFAADGEKEALLRREEQEKADALALSRRQNASEISRLEESLAQAGSALAAAEEELGRAQRETADAEQAVEAHKAALMAAMNRAADVRSTQARLGALEQSLESRLQEAREEASAAGEGRQQLAESLCEAQEELEARNAAKAALDAQARELDESVREAGRRSEQLLAQLNERSRAMHEAASRLKVLREMARDYEGYQNAVRQALAHARGDQSVRGVVANILHTPKKLERALEMVLGPALQNIITEDEHAAKRLIQYLRENKLGRATFLPMSAVRGRVLSREERQVLSMPGCVGVASELVTFQEEYRGIVESLLGRTVVAENLDCGIEIMRRGRHAFRLVTLEGDVMHSGGSMTGGSVQSRMTSLLSREREIAEHAQLVQALEKEIASLQDGLQALDAERAQAKRKRNELFDRAHEAEIDVARSSEHFEGAKAALNEHDARQQKAALLVEQICENLSDIRAQLQQAEQAQSGGDVDRESMQQETVRLQQVLAAGRERVERLHEQSAQRRVSVAEQERELAAVRREGERLRAEEEALTRGREQRARTRQEEMGRNKDDEERLLEGERDLEKLTQALDGARQAHEELIQRQKQAQAQARSLTGELEALRVQVNEEAERGHHFELQLVRAQADLKALQDRVWNEYELTYAGAEAYRREGFNLREADKEIASLRAQIRALGTVNVNAVESYRLTKERFDQLDAQKQDLLKAAEDLQSIITGLLSQMESRFRKRFQMLNGFFGQAFTALFGGGRAELRLTDESDVLGCGIDIVAEPPGKKLQLLSLLSGGERALTAIALLFAMLQLKPTPFCILDEIEAALDEANVANFADTLNNFAKKTQFVVVTHRRGTMERCQALYGVAMEERGVSRMVSVKLEDAS
ncbi:MAG TPA: chromosome segregation protein SMC [Candidatus Aphodomonas merdavium]|nr:chromosome segregation protein SMC [Candidatus Aphodomonas merdavium]